MILQLDVGELMLHPTIEANEIDGFLIFCLKNCQLGTGKTYQPGMLTSFYKDVQGKLKPIVRSYRLETGQTQWIL